MRVLVTGHEGYIGPVMVDALQGAGHEVVGLDAGFFVADQLEPSPRVPTIRRDIRDVTAGDLEGVDAVVHLANISNDPLGFLDPAVTFAVNVDATVRLAELARAAGVRRFLNSSSCSAYGAAVDDWVDETTTPRPVTPYGESKVVAEERLASLADERFCVVSFRNATAFGYTANLRTDLVVNDLTAGAYLRGEIRLNSDGSAWRPLVHVHDIARAFALGLEAPADDVNGEIINVGAEAQNYRVLEVAQEVADRVPNATLSFAEGAGPDKRSYRVRFDKVARLLPEFSCEWNLRRGIEDLVAAFDRVDLRTQDWQGVRLTRLERLMESGQLDETLRFVSSGSRVNDAA